MLSTLVASIVFRLLALPSTQAFPLKSGLDHQPRDSRESTGEWWIIASPSSFCSAIDQEDVEYNWRGSSGECQNFGDSKADCLIVSYDDGTGSAVGCDESDQLPDSIQSMSYLFHTANSHLGCTFYDEKDCGGISDGVRVTSLDMVANCFEFQQGKKSFMCV